MSWVVSWTVEWKCSEKGQILSSHQQVTQSIVNLQSFLGHVYNALTYKDQACHLRSISLGVKARKYKCNDTFGVKEYAKVEDKGYRRIPMEADL